MKDMKPKLVLLTLLTAFSPQDTQAWDAGSVTEV